MPRKRQLLVLDVAKPVAEEVVLLPGAVAVVEEAVRLLAGAVVLLAPSVRDRTPPTQRPLKRRDASFLGEKRVRRMPTSRL